MTDRDAAVDADDARGHRFYSSSDRTIKEDITPVVSEEQTEDDVEGHGITRKF